MPSVGWLSGVGRSGLTPAKARVKAPNNGDESAGKMSVLSCHASARRMGHDDPTKAGVIGRLVVGGLSCLNSL